MTVTINIECDDPKDLMIHLSVIRQQIRGAFKRYIGKETIKIEDANYYGSHTVKIEQ